MAPVIAHAVPVLDRVVIVARHGVRAPTKSPAALAPTAALPWPDWPVAPAELTPRGAENAKRMGGYLRLHYAALLPPGICPAPDQIVVHADGKDRRTIDTAKALLDGLAPGCGLAASHGTAGTPDPVFSGLESGACPLSEPETESLKGSLGTELAHLPGSTRMALDALQAVVAPAACPSSTQCLSGENRLAAGEEGPKIKGPLATGASLAENLSLEYQEGFEGSRLGWGRLDYRTLETIMLLHNAYSALTRRNASLAGHNGAVLAQRVIAALQGHAKLTLFVGHDTNLDNLAGIFGLDWQSPGQPDHTPPDGELVFENWREDDGRSEVHISFRYQTADELRGLATLDAAHPAREVPITPRACTAPCTPSALADLAKKVIPGRCVSG